MITFGRHADPFSAPLVVATVALAVVVLRFPRSGERSYTETGAVQLGTVL
jgi:hypothetical protein